MKILIVEKGGELILHSEMEEIRCSIMRGGTSKAVFFLENDLPNDKVERDRIILAAYGSPDVRQIDGLGGADVLTSKLAIIGPPSRPDCDVDYLFGQVSFEEAFIDYKGNCGNISAAVGPFAIDSGLVKAVEPITSVRIHLLNTGNVIVAEVPVKNGRAQVEGDCVIDGVPGSGARITLDFSDTQGALTGRLLPTGKTKECIATKKKMYTVSIVDVGNPLVFIRAEELGMVGTETPAEIEGNSNLMEEIEAIRGVVATKIGLAKQPETAAIESPYIPFFSIVSKPAEYNCYNGKKVFANEVDIIARLLFMQKMHKTYPGTGTVCTGAAAKIPGTIPWEILNEMGRESTVIRIGHPAGVIQVEAETVKGGEDIQVKRAAFYRTARKIMDGMVYVRKSLFQCEGQ